MKVVISRPDSRHRISLGQFKNSLSPAYKIYFEGNRIILEPIDLTPQETHWLLKPENKHLLIKLENALKEKADKTIDLGQFED